MLIFTRFMQVYIVSGGYSGSSNLASTEILEKDGGSAWQLVASLPFARSSVRGLGLDNGRFMITGECWTILYISTPDAIQVAMVAAGLPTWLSTALKMTSGLQRVISL